jgi:plasmid stabilization system protein ParE
VRLVWSPLALDRVEEIVDCISLDRPQADRARVAGLFDTVRTLAMFPEKGRVVPKVGRQEIRELIHERYRGIYKAEPTRVAILTVRHGRRLLDLKDVQCEP